MSSKARRTLALNNRRGVGLLAACVAVLFPAAAARTDTVTRPYRASTGPLLTQATVVPATNFIGG